jgi:hypothetical protein
LHPSTLTVLVCTPTGRLEPAAAQPGIGQPGIDADAVESEPILRAGVALIRPGELPASLRSLAPLAPDLLATMRGHDERVEGLLVLGARLSDEPDGAEDRESARHRYRPRGAARQRVCAVGRSDAGGREGSMRRFGAPST